MIIWRDWALAPSVVKDFRPAAPHLGQHIGKVSTLESGEWLIVAFDQDSQPYKWLVVPNPRLP